MSRPRVVHLVDDTTAGGVMRVLDHLLSAETLASAADQRLMTVDRGGFGPGRLQAEVIVSHLAVSWRSLPMMALLRLLNPRSRLIHVEHSYTENFVSHCVPRKGRFRRLLRTAYGLFDTVVAVSAAQGAWLERSGAVAAEKLQVIRSCVDLEAFRALAPRSGPVSVFGAIGRLDRQKGFDLLIEAFREVPDREICLRIFGEGPERDRLMRLAGDDDRIRFEGFAANPVDAFAEVDAVVMPSRWEAYGLVATEALAANRLLLVNPIDGLRDHLVNGAISAGSTTGESWTRLIGQVAGEGPAERSSQEGKGLDETSRALDAWAGLFVGA